MKRKLGFFVAVAALVMLAILPRIAPAQMMGHGGMMEHEGMMGGMPPLPVFLRAAKLTPDQQARVKKILHDNHASFHSQFEQMHAAREQMAAKLFSAGPLTATDLSAQTREIAQAQQQLLQNEINVALQIRALLTPEQLQKVAQFHQQFESLHKQMRTLLGPNGPPSFDGPPPPDAPPPV